MACRTPSGVIGRATGNGSRLASRVYAIVKKRMSTSPDSWHGGCDDILLDACDIGFGRAAGQVVISRYQRYVYA